MAKTCDREKVERWRALLAEKAASGESVAAFCDRHGFPAHQFYWWRRRLNGTGEFSAQEKAVNASQFVAVRVGAPLPVIEVVHPSGCTIRVAAGLTDARPLRTVLDALRTGEV